MVMVGGGAVNFHGYQRHSADVDFWVDCTAENLKRLASVLEENGFEDVNFPESVKTGEQNISLKYSPSALEVELITRFSSHVTFDEAFTRSESVEVSGKRFLRWRVLSYEDLIDSKLRAGRPKDFLDIQELKRRRTGLG